MNPKVGRPKVASNLRAVNIALETSQYSKLQQLAVKSGFSINQIVRQAVDAYLARQNKSEILCNLVAHHLIIYPHPKETDQNWNEKQNFDKWFVENFSDTRGLTIRNIASNYTCAIALDHIKNVTDKQLELGCQIVFHPKEGVRYVPLSIL